ncbi:hypothetical protein H8B02_41585 [Bradyrhizobium sp. Pear77]|uniref:hypothetical protein n=1 Tax=Bradyrhizobium TaxID=374 RepID=UPI001E3D657C|nr:MULTISPECIES: hypothetical protein [Bradyrhizobium]MCC8959669.1 hypothetical protein [Bradyrhizobium altum]MCC8968627.1 hypothetical protein [Bradyrhizobium oropedii]
MDGVHDPLANTIAALISRQNGWARILQHPANIADAPQAMLIPAYGPSRELLLANLIVLRKFNDGI